MLNFKFLHDKITGEEYIETSITGKLLLTNPQLNKGTAFTEEERHELNLLGKLPAQVETLEEQVKRAYFQFTAYNDDLQKNIYLNNLHDKNQVLFYKLVSDHITEMLPLIYTPIVGTAVKKYSQEFRQARGLYIAYPYRDRIEEILDNRSHPEIDLIVVTDGEGVLGIGDQGIGGMDISIAKLMVYTLCAGIHPLRTLPILLDVGTNNEQLLNDPLYLGLRHKRIAGKDYDDFIANFVQAVEKKFPHVFFQWEDFGRENARRNLDLYRDKICSFNDDIQGTGVVTLAALLAAVKSNQSELKNQRIIIYGAGTAGTGIADQISEAMQREGLSKEKARERIWLIDRFGLITTITPDITEEQRPYLHHAEKIAHWNVKSTANITLLETIRHVHPTILIGSSAQAGAFNETCIREMSKFIPRPIIFPLSNPTELIEATPENIINWSEGRALVAAGSPFSPVRFQDKEIAIAQCNNALVFPGLGLGVIASKASHVSDEMLWVACQTLVEMSPIMQDSQAALLPTPSDARKVARAIGIAVANRAREEGVSRVNENVNFEERVDNMMWYPHYVKLRKN
jgi:malate dehydrogenase (oxaloacetate-decarboxylating)